MAPSADGAAPGRAGLMLALLVLYVAALPWVGFLAAFPDIPAAQEAGFPDRNVVGWQGLTAPTGLPAPIVAPWVRLIEDASKDPALIEQAVRINKVLAYRGPDAVWAFQNEELAKYLPLATKMGIRK